jgi:hypothetical protein
LAHAYVPILDLYTFSTYIYVGVRAKFSSFDIVERVMRMVMRAAGEQILKVN